ncbi:NADH:flavin oxidoreductase/NADH oxidase [Methylobacterium sp. 4-46]|uniref:oxidoreductase n=1 Tax=unclassified Methylobacterium TaxID=2615210 RepID=UPI000152D81D|nr:MULTISPECIES: FAD-dependent oxidoreductase [Methylobacterium]ACA18234.1 NADH:flavin oxidoreductase/NADH oxidase [Methylobacterium sp. 4-46]WFT77531.1 FAD-dependent oxidoreductase [Methylobacterium nodulans]
MSRRLEHLFSPLRIRDVEIRNRILSTGHQTFLARDGVPGEDLVAYHEARARGGAGLIIVESARFHASALSDAPELNVSDDRCIPGYRALAEAVHRHGGRVFGQLSHAGRLTRRIRGGVREVAFAPSAVPDNRFQTMPREMPTAMVEEVVEACGAAAGRFAEAGLDGVEIVASHGLLFAQFLNPRTNLRTDRYGGTPENRLRFLAECLSAVRKAVGGRVVGMRISVEEVELDGLDAAEVLAACKALAALGILDYVNTTTGSMAGPGGSVHVVPPMGIAPAYVAPQAGTLRAQVGLPVFVAGRINQPQVAEEVLRAGLADMCGMTRAMISDPDLGNKAAAGRFDDIRACIACNQACIGHFHAGYSISCIQNPVTGREARLPAMPRSGRKRVLVAGGGPGGMKAAATAAARGHDVVLCEAGRRLGGQALLAQLLPDRAEFGGLITNLEREIAQAGIEIRLDTRVDRALVEELRPDEVVVATGALPYEPAIEGREDAHVVGAWAVLNGGANLGTRVLVADWRADWVGMGVAEKLVRDGHQVTLAVNAPHAGYNLQIYLRNYWISKLHKLGVQIVTDARIYGADGTTAYLVHNASNEAIVRDDVDTIVLATGHASATDLERELDGLPVPVHPIGDCLSPRSAEEAILEGFVVARGL